MDPMEAIRADRVVAVVRADRVPDPAGLATALARSGIRAVEFTFTIPDVLDVIEAASGSGAVVGAGTILRPHQAEAAVEAGARFVVSPVCKPELVEAAGDVPVFLAGFTPTEIQVAVEAGAAAVKLFPARVGGPDYVADLLGPLPDAYLIPSGGIDATNARRYLAAGAVAVYAGSSLAPAGAVESGDHQEIARRAEALVGSISS